MNLKTTKCYENIGLNGLYNFNKKGYGRLQSKKLTILNRGKQMQKIYNSFRSNPHINKILESEQFPYSEKIMELRIKLNIDIR